MYPTILPFKYHDQNICYYAKSVTFTKAVAFDLPMSIILNVFNIIADVLYCMSIVKKKFIHSSSLLSVLTFERLVLSFRISDK